MDNRLNKDKTRFSVNKAVFMRFFVFLLVLITTVAAACGGRVSPAETIPDETDYLSFDGNYKNVILMIGDGMGFNHVECAEGYYGKKTFLNSSAREHLSVETNSLYLFGPTDSAAAATALSTGQKTDNGAIARYNGKDILTNAERAKAKGMAVGIIATEGVSGATPAAFSSHADNRNDSDDIFDGQLESKIDLFLGGNREYYDERRERIENSGYGYFNDPAADFSSETKVWGSYEIKPLPESDGDGIALAELVGKAIAFLENASENGYFLMIEESYIDKRSHSRRMLEMLERLKSFDLATEKVVKLAQDDGNTLVMATADHETGNLTIPKDADFSKASDSWFRSGSHTAKNVPLYCFMPVGTFKTDVVDNTQIAEICRYYIEKR